MATTEQRLIWHVDYEKHIRNLAKAYLERHGFAYHGFDSHKELMDGLANATQQPDLIVMEVVGSRDDEDTPGWEMMKSLKRIPDMRNIPVIALTALAQDSDVFDGWQNGVECYLTKPFSPFELVAMVKRIFKESQSPLESRTAWQ